MYFQSECECYDKDKHDFLIHQLNLYKALCYVRITLEDVSKRGKYNNIWFYTNSLQLLRLFFCKGRNDYSINMITKELRYLTWEEAFLSLRSDILPEAIRAKYCDLTTSAYMYTKVLHFHCISLYFIFAVFFTLTNTCLMSPIFPKVCLWTLETTTLCWIIPIFALSMNMLDQRTKKKAREILLVVFSWIFYRVFLQVVQF